MQIKVISNINNTNKNNQYNKYKEGSLCWAVQCFENGEKEMLHNNKRVILKNNGLYYDLDSKYYQNLFFDDIEKILTGWSKIEKYGYISIFDWGVSNELYKTIEDANNNSKDRDSFIQTSKVLLKRFPKTREEQINISINNDKLKDLYEKLKDF